LQACDTACAVPIYTFLSSINDLKCTVMAMEDSGRAEMEVGVAGGEEILPNNRDGSGIFTCSSKYSRVLIPFVSLYPDGAETVASSLNNFI
jgi:hypothetical protein